MPNIREQCASQKCERTLKSAGAQEDDRWLAGASPCNGFAEVHSTKTVTTIGPKSSITSDKSFFLSIYTGKRWCYCKYIFS